MARPNWEYIRVDVLLPEHPKIDLLSRSARWTLVEMWCYCGRNRTDGIISGPRWKTFGTPAERRQITDAGFADPIGRTPADGYVMHGYLEHQRSREQIDELSAKRTEAAQKAAAARWGKDAKSHGLPHAKPHRLRMRHAYASRCQRQRQRQIPVVPDRCLVAVPYLDKFRWL